MLYVIFVIKYQIKFINFGTRIKKNTNIIHKTPTTITTTHEKHKPIKNTPYFLRDSLKGQGKNLIINMFHRLKLRLSVVSIQQFANHVIEYTAVSMIQQIYFGIESQYYFELACFIHLTK